MSTINRTLIQAYAQEALQAFVTSLAPLNVLTHSITADPTKRGSAISVPRFDAVTATTFASDYATAGGTMNTVTVTLDKHKIAPVDVTDIQALNHDVTVFQFAQQQGQSLGKAVLQDVFSVVLTTNFGTEALSVSATALAKTDVLTLRKTLALAGAANKASLVSNVVGYTSLLSDINVAYANQFGGTEAIRNAAIPSLYGMPVYECGALPTNSISLLAFALHPDAIVFAMRGFGDVVPEEEYLAFETVVDPATGISMQMRVFYKPDTGKFHSVFECNYGYAVGLSTGLALARSKD